ncbi:MAG: METTL5 family protein [Candidatus Heimdallarchaeota archaeon]
MNRKNLEIFLSQNLVEFTDPNISLEQYSTPPRVAANLIQRASELGDIHGKRIIELCAGTGILSIAATVFGGRVTAVEIDKNAVQIMKQNLEKTDLECEIKHVDALYFQSPEKFDTAILNPPFGIQQKKARDMDFIIQAHELADIAYTIVDGSIKNQTHLPILLAKSNIDILESYLEEFPIKKSYPWHKYNRKIHQVMILRTCKA